MRKYGETIVECKRIACNPCASDEYEVTIKPHDEPEQVIYTLATLFERDENICERVYRQWLNGKNK